MSCRQYRCSYLKEAGGYKGEGLVSLEMVGVCVQKTRGEA